MKVNNFLFTRKIERGKNVTTRITISNGFERWKHKRSYSKKTNTGRTCSKEKSARRTHGKTKTGIRHLEQNRQSSTER